MKNAKRKLQINSPGSFALFVVNPLFDTGRPNEMHVEKQRMSVIFP